jgi:predicted small lipoprotein YifL
MKIMLALVLLSLSLAACGQRVYPAKPANTVQDSTAY